MSMTQPSGDRAWRERRATLTRLGAIEAWSDAYALAVRAWPLLPHFFHGNPIIGPTMFPETHAQITDTRDLFALVQAKTYDERDLSGDITRWTPDGRDADDLIGLEGKDPGSAVNDPLLDDMARALSITLPALWLAVVDALINVTWGRADQASYRRLILDIYRRRRHADPDYEQNLPLVERMLGEISPSWPLELNGQALFMVFVASYGHAAAHDGGPIQCFTSLEAARRYAVLQIDWSREVISGNEGRLDREFTDMVRSVAACTRRGIAVEGSTIAWTTYLLPVSAEAGAYAFDCAKASRQPEIFT